MVEERKDGGQDRHEKIGAAGAQTDSINDLNSMVTQNIVHSSIDDSVVGDELETNTENH